MQLSNMPENKSKRIQEDNPMIRCGLTIGGSDCSGGAGIETDLAIFRDAGVASCTVITALTAQTAQAIHRIEPTPCAQILASIRAVADLGGIDAIKTGMLVDCARINAVATGIAENFPDVPLIVDPVLVASSGRRLLSEDALETLCHMLLPRATVITPNLDEAAVLLGHTVQDRKSAALCLSERFHCAILLKGGHDSDSTITETLALSDGSVQQWRFARHQLTPEQAHGTGCRTASAIAAAIALKLPLQQAIPLAHRAAIDGCWQRH